MCSDGAEMAKLGSLFNLMKRLFTSETESKKKEKRRKWVFLGRLRIKNRLPSPTHREKTNLNQAEEEQSKPALNAAISSASVAETAIADEAVLLTRINNSTQQREKKTEEHPILKIQNRQCQRNMQELAAIKIQTAFRGYLARKALRALKGIVKLQAIIRGTNVRRQAMNTLKCLQSIVNIQSQVCAKRTQIMEPAWHNENSNQIEYLRDKIIRMDTNSQKRWDGSILKKEEADAMVLSRKEAAIKRDRIKEYSFNHRNSAETERNKVNGRLKYWLEQWVDTQVAKSKELEDLDSVVTVNPKPRMEFRGKQLGKLRGLQRQQQYNIEGLDSPMAAPRRSFHKRQNSLGEGNGFSKSPVIPTYMAATESARAKTRSLSSPKLRPGSFDTCSESYSPCKNKLFPMSSTPGGYNQQRSPGLKGLPGPIRSSRTLKDLSFDSECSFGTWDQQYQYAFM